VIAAAQGWARVTEQAAVRKRATELRIVAAEAETILVTARFKRTTPQEALAPSEALRARPAHKALVRVVLRAGRPLVVAEADVRAAEDVADD
jgi:hypothetical protein